MKTCIVMTSFLGLMLAGCGGEENPQKPVQSKELIVVKDGVYTEYYPGGEKVRIQGEQTEDGKRTGKWTYFSPDGKEMSYTFFKDGKKHGFSYNSYPNGAPYYYGEYWNDTMVGVWKSYDTLGVVSEKDFGYPDNY